MDITCELPKATDVAVANLPTAVVLLIEAVARGEAGGMFPVVAKRVHDEVWLEQRHLAGEAESRFLASVLAHQQFAPLTQLLIAIDAWCHRHRIEYADMVRDGVLRVTNADLFGPLVCDVFSACAAGRNIDLAAYMQVRFDHYAAFLSRFLTRFSCDADILRRSMDSRQIEILGLEAMGLETHNGGNRVIKVDTGHTVFAYKPGPARGEDLFCNSEAGQPASIFGLLNELPPAAGKFWLPQLRCWRGQGADRNDYLWQEWIYPPRDWQVVDTAGEMELHGTVVDNRGAQEFWHAAGALAAACFAFGIADLIGGNLLVGVSKDDALVYYPVDIEVFFADVQRLHETGLTEDPTSDNHHVGFENRKRWCGLDGPQAFFLVDDQPDGPQLYWRQTVWGQGGSRCVVSDSDGNSGYGAYLSDFLRGAFDVWATICDNRAVIKQFIAQQSRDRCVRVLVRSTSDYTMELQRRVIAPYRPSVVEFTAPELAQLARGDVPFFFTPMTGGPLLQIEPKKTSQERQPVDLKPLGDEVWPPVSAAVTGETWNMDGFGVFVRDAVRYADGCVAAAHREDCNVDEGSDGDSGRVTFDWPKDAATLVYSWNNDIVGLDTRSKDDTRETAELDRLADIRLRLLRIDEVDSILREKWTASGFTDTAIEAKLDALCESALAWLGELVAEYGWLTSSLVGTSASQAASRLVQHAKGPREVQHSCLDLMREAAAHDKLDWRQVAYVTDALLIGEKLPQRYGTKFREIDGELEPCPMEAPAEIDQRRSSMGMEPLSDYAQLVRDRFNVVKAASI